MTNHVNQLTHAERTLVEGSADFNDDQWLLFHTDTDFAEVHDLAGAYPERLEHLVERWHALAMSNQVLPIDDGNHRIAHMHTPWLQFRRHYELAPGDKLHEVQAPVWFGGFRMAATFGAPQKPKRAASSPSKVTGTLAGPGFSPTGPSPGYSRSTDQRTDLAHRFQPAPGLWCST